MKLEVMRKRRPGALFEMKGLFECWLSDPRWDRPVFVGRYENLYTNNSKERLLRTLLQTTVGDKVSATDYAAKLAYCTDPYPATPHDSVISGIADDPNGYVAFNVLNNISSSSSSCYGTKTASYTNASGGDLTITYLAVVYDNDPAADNVYCMSNIDDTEVLNGQTFTVNYIWQFNYDTSEAV